MHIFTRERHRYFKRFLVCLSFLTVLIAHTSFSQSGDDPFAFFRPSVDITSSERARLDDGYPFSNVIPSKGHEVAVLAGVPVKVDGDRLLAWERQIEELKRNPHVIAIGRFSNPPRIEDLAGLELDSKDISAIQSCRPGNCDLKLCAGEMEQLKQAEAEAKADPAAAVQQAFRQLVLNRVQQYLANGSIPADEDHHEQVQPASRFALLLDHTPFLEDRLPQLAKHLRDYPSGNNPGVESVLYWSKEHVARKSVISVTHLSIVRNHDPDLPEVLVVGRDVFSTHYVDASLSVTALVRGTDTMNYLIYINRTDIDVLHGVFAGMIRRSTSPLEKRRRLSDRSPPTPGKR